MIKEYNGFKIPTNTRMIANIQDPGERCCGFGGADCDTIGCTSFQCSECLFRSDGSNSTYEEMKFIIEEARKDIALEEAFEYDLDQIGHVTIAPFLVEYKTHYGVEWREGYYMGKFDADQEGVYGKTYMIWYKEDDLNYTTVASHVRRINHSK